MTKLTRTMMRLTSIMVFGVALLNFSTCCMFIYHQPKLPESINVE